MLGSLPKGILSTTRCPGKNN